MRKKLKEDAFFIKTISKVIVSATENSLMPLVQLSLMFPKMLFWFQKVPKNTSLKSCFDSAKFNFSNPDNLDMIPKCIENLEPSWVFGFTIASIVMSLLSMASTLTMAYFSKPGKKALIKYPSKLFVYFNSIIFQVIPRILAYEAFAFGVVGKLLAPFLIIPSLLILPLLMVSLRAIVYRVYIRLSKRRYTITRPVWASLLFGLSSLYSFNEHNFYSDGKNKNNFVVADETDVEHGGGAKTNTNEEQLDVDEDENDYAEDSIKDATTLPTNVENDKIRKRKDIQLCHIAYDVQSTVENIGLACAGAFNIVDENFDHVYFIVILSILQFFGLTCKAAYYLFLHPWEKLNPQIKKYQYAFGFLIFLLATSILVTIWIYFSVTVKILSACLVSVALIIGLIWLVGSGHLTSIWEDGNKFVSESWTQLAELWTSFWNFESCNNSGCCAVIGGNIRQIARNLRQSRLCPRNYRRVPNNDSTVVHHPEDIEMNQNTTNEFAHDPEEVESLNATVSTNLSVSNIESV